ncbi:MAG: NAD/NADP octopine/nopaline dehydrogenase family protein [Gemmataceae bacterium]
MSSTSLPSRRRMPGRRYSFYLEGIARNAVVGPIVEEIDQIRLRVAAALGCSVFGLRQAPREDEWRDVMRRIDRLDAEAPDDPAERGRRRAELLRPIHNAVVSGQHWLAYTYGVQRIPGESLPAAIGRTPNFMKDSFPQARYADEDIATGLVPLEALARRLGIECAPITHVIDLYAKQSGRDARADGRNLRAFDLAYLQRYLLGEVECLALAS